MEKDTKAKVKATEAVVKFDKKELAEAIAEAQAKSAETLKRRAKKLNTKEDKAKLAKAKEVNKEVTFFKAFAAGDIAEVKSMHASRAKALNEGTGSAGGYLVPEEFETRVFAKLDDYSRVRKEALVLPMSSQVKDLNSLATDVTVTITGESTKIPESNPVFGEPVLTARKYNAITAYSEELFEDAEVKILDLLAGRYAQAIAKKEDDQFLNGTVSGSEGLLAVSGVSTVVMDSGDTTFDKITYDYLRDMKKEAQEYSTVEGENGVFIMHPSVWNTVAQSKPSGAGYYGGSPTSGWAQMAWGSKVLLSNNAPSTTAVSTKFVVYGDLSQHLVIGDRAGLKIKILEEGTVGSNNLGENDMQALRVVKRTANTVVLPAGIVNLVTAAS